MAHVLIRYAPLAPEKNAPKLDYAAANAALEQLIRAKVEAAHRDIEVNLEPGRQLDVRLSTDIAKMKGLKSGVQALVGEAYEELDPSEFALE